MSDSICGWHDRVYKPLIEVFEVVIAWLFYITLEWKYQKSEEKKQKIPIKIYSVYLIIAG